ncbi:MAG TPA: Hpt domain-containing protein [Parvularculaceae bacterium]|nr:Hpt domain-containing protein [Parvularculaceae bacterium]
MGATNETGTKSPQSAEPILDREQINGLVAAAGVDGTREILNAFWRSTDVLFRALQDQLSRGDLVEAAKSAHALKGSSLNVGALRLSAAARHIEECCRAQNGGAALDRLSSAEAGYAETVAAFDAHLATAA